MQHDLNHRESYFFPVREIGCEEVVSFVGTPFAYSKLWLPRTLETHILGQNNRSNKTPSRCKSILVVEDEPLIRDTLQIVLEAEGYIVNLASNGQEALDMIPRMDLPCLILLDLMMPVMDGWQFAKVLTKDLVLATIPVVIVSAYADNERRVPGAREIIKKPIELDALLKIVSQYCD